MVVMIKCMYHQWSLWYVMILHVFSIKTIPLLIPLGLSPQGGRYRGILLYTIPPVEISAIFCVITKSLKWKLLKSHEYSNILSQLSYN